MGRGGGGNPCVLVRAVVAGFYFAKKRNVIHTLSRTAGQFIRNGGTVLQKSPMTDDQKQSLVY